MVLCRGCNSAPTAGLLHAPLRVKVGIGQLLLMALKVPESNRDLKVMLSGAGVGVWRAVLTEGSAQQPSHQRQLLLRRCCAASLCVLW
jgi:hypothetical protein